MTGRADPVSGFLETDARTVRAIEAELPPAVPRCLAEGCRRDVEQLVWGRGGPVFGVCAAHALRARSLGGAAFAVRWSEVVPS